MTPVEIDDQASRVFENFIACEYAYFTPKGEPLCWPVTPYWYPQKQTLAIATGLAYPTKADYAKRNPKVALLFSDSKGSGIDDAPEIEVHGNAVVLDDDMQANADRYVTELRAKSSIARAAINPLTVKLLDFYLPRLWVEITVANQEARPPARYQHATTKWADVEASGDRVKSPITASPASQANARALKTMSTYESGVAVVKGTDGYPKMLRTSFEILADGSVRLRQSPGEGPACLTFHRHSLWGTRFTAHMARGQITGGIFEPRKFVGFFGNGAVFPLSAIPNVAKLRRRLHRELERRGKPMPKLRVP